MKPGVKRILLLSLLGLCLAAAHQIFAHSQATTGVIEGTIADESGAVIPGVGVTVTHIGTGFERQVTTNESGSYRAILLPLGAYRVTAEQGGFATLMREGIDLSVGETVTIDMTLKVSPIADAITITEPEPLIEVSHTETSAGLDERAVRTLPTGSRNYLDYLRLTSNAVITQGVEGAQININGQKAVQTGFFVDGASANNAFFGEQRGGQGPVANVALEAVKEFQVVAQGAPAEFGGYSGVFINVVTRSGTNRFHGSLFHVQEAGSLTQGLADGTRWKDYHREQFGVSASGPVVKDRAFYFGTYEQTVTRLKKDNDLIHCCTTFLPGGVAMLTSPGEGGLPIDLDEVFRTRFDSPEVGPIPRTNDLQAFLAKVDINPTEGHQITARHYFGRSIQENGTFDVINYGRTATGQERDLTNAFIAQWTAAFSSTRLNEFRFQYGRETRPRTQVLPPDLPDVGFGPSTENLDFDAQGRPTAKSFRFGRPFFLPNNLIDERYQWTDNFSILSGNHSIKMGFDINFIKIKNFFQAFARGRFIFNTVEGFLNYIDIGPQFVECSDGSTGTTGQCPDGAFITGPLLVYLQFAPIGNFTLDEVSNNNFNQFENAIYLQDTWQARPGLTINYGFRWDNFNQPENILPVSESRFAQFLDDPRFPSDGEIPDYHEGWQPRLGIAWDPRHDGKTVIRLNGGVFFARMPGLMIVNARRNNGSIATLLFQASFFNAFGVTPPPFPDCATAPFTPPACKSPPGFQPIDPGVSVFDRNFVYPRTYQFSGGGEREIMRDLSVSLMFNYALASHLNRSGRFNQPASVGTGPDGRPLFTPGGLGPFSGPNGDGSGIATISSVIESSARSLYRSLTIAVNKKFSRGFSIASSYTYARDVDDDSNENDPFTFRFSDSDDFTPERGPSDRDRRHRFSFYSIWELPAGFVWSHTLTAQSATPRSLLCNFDANFDGTDAGDRAFTDGRGNFSCGPAGAGRALQLSVDESVTLVASLENGRDSGRNRFRKNDGFFEWNMRLQRDFRWGTDPRYTLSLSIEAFNITDNDNLRIQAISGELRSSFLGTLFSRAGDPSRLRLGARFTW